MTVLELLQSCHVDHEVFNHPPAYSAQRRAKILHTRGHCVVKCLLMSGPFGRFLALLPADRRVHFPTLSRELGGKVTLARPEEIEPLFLECEGGVVPPFGRPFGLGMVLDDSILPEETIVVEGRHHMEAIRLKCSDLERMELPRRVAFSQPWPMVKAC